jgi:biopolymer transport protein ExbD
MKRNKSRDIIIDLTSLLDVVFIVLMVVNLKSTALQQVAEEKLADANSQIASAETAQEIYEAQLDNLGVAKDLVTTVAIVSTYEEDRPSTRHIAINLGGVDEEPIELSGSNTGSKFDELEKRLTDFVNDHPGTIIVMSLNQGDEDILYRDEKQIMSILEKLEASSDFVRING